MGIHKCFHDVLDFKKPCSRLPLIEWAPWWNDTVRRWESEGLPEGMAPMDICGYFGLDKAVCVYVPSLGPDCPAAASHGSGVITDEESYERIKPLLYSDSSIKSAKSTLFGLKKQHDEGELIIRLWIDGFFWHPRNLLGIEKHLMAFYDDPGLMLMINEDLAAYNTRLTEELMQVLIPDMIGFAEDMSYNHGPMISYDFYKRFILPYYLKVVPALKKYGLKVFVDSDGNIEQMIPWFLESGIDGILPLERQAGVDIARIRRMYPRLLMMGGYDKMVMSKSEEDMAAEFERILPVMRSGGYIPSVDHQTPPGVSLDNYRVYLRLFREYAEKAAG